MRKSCKMAWPFSRRQKGPSEVGSEQSSCPWGHAGLCRDSRCHWVIRVDCPPQAEWHQDVCLLIQGQKHGGVLSLCSRPLHPDPVDKFSSCLFFFCPHLPAARELENQEPDLWGGREAARHHLHRCQVRWHPGHGIPQDLCGQGHSFFR